MKRGYILVFSLVILMIISELSLKIIKFSYNNILVIKNDYKLNQMMEIEEKVIPMIKERFYNNRINTFLTLKNNSLIIVTFEDNIAKINIIGKYNYVAYLEYNEDNDTVEDYYYE